MCVLASNQEKIKCKGQSMLKMECECKLKDVHVGEISKT